VTFDLGAGDGHFVLARAAARPDELVVGVDASHAAMAEASRRAARSSRHGGFPNAQFVVAAVECLPRELAGLGDLVTVHFPWGSLLHGAAGAEPWIARRLAVLVADGGRLRLLLSGTHRDQRRGASEIDPANVIATFKRLGLVALEVRPATLTDARAARSSWGKRLLSGENVARLAWFFELARKP